jgi:hypothetical protein
MGLCLSWRLISCWAMTWPHPTLSWVGACLHPALGWTVTHPRPTPSWAKTGPRPNLCWVRDASASNSMLGQDSTPTPNPMLGQDVPAPNPMLGYGASALNPLLGQEHERTQLHIGLWCVRPWPFLGIVTSWTQLLLGSVCELNPTSLRLSAQLKGHFTLNLSYPESGLIIIIPIIILLNTNKQSMFTLIRCDGTSNKIILSYSYKIIFLPLLRCMKHVKSCNIKEDRNIQKGVQNFIL